MSAEPMRGNLCPVCDQVAWDYEPGVSCVVIDGIYYHPDCAPGRFYRKWTRHIEEERARIEAEASRLDFDKLFLRVAEEVARMEGMKMDAMMMGKQAADADWDRIERELAAIDLLESVGLGPEVAE